MPGLESSGMIVPVGAWVFAQASADCRGWRRLGLPRIKIGLNVSPSQLVASQVEPLIIRIRDLLDSCDVQLEGGGAHTGRAGMAPEVASYAALLRRGHRDPGFPGWTTPCIDSSGRCRWTR